LKLYTIDFSSLSVTAKNVYADMGYRRQHPEEQVVELTESLLEEIRNITVPLCAFQLYGGDIDGETVCLDEGARLQVGAILSSLLQNSESFAIFTATAGNSFQQFQDDLKKENDMLKIYIADTIGSCIAEAAGDYMENMLEKEISGLKHTKRFSPGYCGWHLSGQKEIFRLLGGKPCDISLSDVCLMKPIKSISGIIGIGTNVKEGIYGCRYCEMKTCYKRKK
jgi:hypothetical protein